VRAGSGSTAPFIGKARGGEMRWATGATLRAKGKAGRAEGARGSGSVGRRSSWHAIVAVCRVAVQTGEGRIRGIERSGYMRPTSTGSQVAPRSWDREAGG
jgi:hypothetical protein